MINHFPLNVHYKLQFSKAIKLRDFALQRSCYQFLSDKGAPEIFPIEEISAQNIHRMAAASYSLDVLQTFYGLTTWQHKYQLKKGMKILTPSDILHTRIFQISEAIQNLPPEIGEKIYKDFVAIKLRERKEMGWDEVHYDINEAPFGEKQLKIVMVLFCYKCNGACGRDGLWF